MKKYPKSIEAQMKNFHSSLREKDRRRYAGIEAIKLGRGGRKSILSTREGIDEAFLEIIEASTAGSPMDESIKWTNLSQQEIADRLGDKGFKVSVDIAKQSIVCSHIINKMLSLLYKDIDKEISDIYKNKVQEKSSTKEASNAFKYSLLSAVILLIIFAFYIAFRKR